MRDPGLLARDAEGLFWMARYFERAENLAQLLREMLVEKPLSHILATGLHEYLDIMQIQLQTLAACIGRTFFRDWRPAPASTQAREQVQG